MPRGIPGKSSRLTTPRLVAGLGAVSALLLLAGCNSASGVVDKFFNMNTPSNVKEVGEDFFEGGYCPPIRIRPGTEVLVLYTKPGEQTGENIRYQETITKTARECHYPGGQLTLKIGVAGRVAAGPKGGPGKVIAPVRIAVVKGDTLAYSELQKIEVNVTAPELATDFARVVNVPVASGPTEQDVEIHIGFDDQPAGKTKKK
jgi:hypothetical protein